MLPKPKIPGVPPRKAEVNQIAEVLQDGEGAQMSLFEHLDELRERLTKAILGLVAGTAVGVLFAGTVLQYLITPYGERLQIIDPTGSVISYFRVALMIGAILTIPLTTYQLLMFILPGLTRKERRILLTSLPAVTALFLVGVLFAWFILIPPAFEFLSNFQQQIFKTEWVADQYLGFITALLFWMGVAFETPLIFFVLALLGFVTAPTLIHNWRVAVVVSAIAAAIITPTVDPVNMMLVMGPMLALYALSIVLVIIARRINKVDAA